VTLVQNAFAAGITTAIDGSFTFSDSDGDLNGGSFKYTYEGGTNSLPLPGPLAGVTNATVAFQLLAELSSNTGTVIVPCWLVDRAGHSSNIFEISFTQLWTRQFGTVLEDIGNGLAIDSTDHVLVAGTTLGDLDGETNPGDSTAFVTKYAPDTSRSWTRVFGSSSTDIGRAVASDSTGSVYVTGETQGTSFDGETADGSLNGFLTKFDSGGTRQWTRVIGTADADRALAAATDGDNNIYVVGETLGDLDGENNAGSWDAFLIKFNSSGTRVWTRLLGSNGVDTAYGVTVDSDGNVNVTGATDGVLGVDPSPGDFLVNYDAFVAKFDPNGTRLWVTQLGTSCTEWANGIAPGTGGKLYVVGMIISPCAFAGNTSNGLLDAFVAYLDGNNGAVQWARQFGTSQFDVANGVTTDSAGNAYVTGFQDSVYFNDDFEGHVIFLAKYDSVGNQSWLVQEAASNSWGNQGRAAAIDSHNNIFVTGMVHGQLDGHINASVGEDDAFILKFDSGGTRR